MRACLLALVAATSWPVAGHAHLLVTEVGYDPGDETGATAEFVEILNPDAGPATLDDVWLCNDEEAYPLVVNGPIPSGITADDWVYRFPAGIALGAGQMLVACHERRVPDRLLRRGHACRATRRVPRPDWKPDAGGSDPGWGG